MSAADLYGGCPRCGVNVDPDVHDCFTPPPAEVVSDDLAGRLRRAVARLEELRDRRGLGGFEKSRLDGKIEGVKLAASYLEEGERIFPAGGSL